MEIWQDSGELLENEDMVNKRLWNLWSHGNYVASFNCSLKMRTSLEIGEPLFSQVLSLVYPFIKKKKKSKRGRNLVQWLRHCLEYPQPIKKCLSSSLGPIVASCWCVQVTDQVIGSLQPIWKPGLNFLWTNRWKDPSLSLTAFQIKKNWK